MEKTLSIMISIMTLVFTVLFTGGMFLITLLNHVNPPQQVPTTAQVVPTVKQAQLPSKP